MSEFKIFLLILGFVGIIVSVFQFLEFDFLIKDMKEKYTAKTVSSYSKKAAILQAILSISYIGYVICDDGTTVWPTIIEVSIFIIAVIIYIVLYKGLKLKKKNK